MAELSKSAVVLPFAKPADKPILNVRAQATTAEIDFFGVVGGGFWDDSGITKEQFAAELKKLSSSVKTVTMTMSSPGGDVFDGRAIANMIKQHRAKFEINVIAEALSIASIIAMAGDSIHMAEGSIMLVHRCYTIARGNSVEMKKLAAELDLIDSEMTATYARRTGMKPAAITALMDENRYMNAEECKTLGFCDTIDAGTTAQFKGLKIAAMDIDRAAFGLPPLPVGLRPRRTAALLAIGHMKALA